MRSTLFLTLYTLMICSATSAENRPLVEHGTQSSANQATSTQEEAVFNPTMLHNFVVSGILVGKSYSPNDLPDFEDYSFGSKDLTQVDLTTLKNDDPRWNSAIRRFWAARVHLLQREMEKVAELVPRFKSRWPLSFRVEGVSDIGSNESYIDTLVPSDFTEVDTLRKKLMQLALMQEGAIRQGKRPPEAIRPEYQFRIPEMKSSDYFFYVNSSTPETDFFAKLYALTQNPDWRTSRYAFTPGAHFEKKNLGRFNAQEQEALRLRPRSEISYQNMVQQGRNDALEAVFYGDDFNEISSLGLHHVLFSFFSELASKSENKEVMKAWWDFFLTHRESPMFLKIFNSEGEHPSREISLSMAKLLLGFEKTLTTYDQKLFRELREKYGLTFENLDDAHRRNSQRGKAGNWDDILENDGFPKRRMHVEQEKEEKPLHPTSMPEIGGWKVTPEAAGQVPNKQHTYRVNRKVVEYANELPGFAEALAKLSKQAHWIDAGSGDAFAIEDYLTRKDAPKIDDFAHYSGETDEHREVRAKAVAEIAAKPFTDRAKVTGVTLKTRRKLSDFDGHFRNLEGRFLEAIPDEELGKADLITDEIGVLSYANQPDVVLNKYFRLLKPGGLITVNLSTGRTIIQTKSGEQMPLADWLEKQSGVEIERSTSRSHSRFAIRVKGDKTPVVPSLKFVFSDTHSPPRRVYIEE